MYEMNRHLILKSSHIPAACFATRPGVEMEDGRGRKGGRKEARQGGGSEAGKDGGSGQRGRRRKGKREEARQGGGRKRGSALRTKLKSRG